MESAKTQDYISRVQRFEELGQEEIEELSVVPSAVSEPQWALHVCDNRCREERFKFFQSAAGVSQKKEKQRTSSTRANNAAMRCD